MSEVSSEFLIALAGNPNCGKTTLFNAITGARQHVGNYPGITVEKKEGFYNLNGQQIRLVDLPGTYSLTAYSLEELVARNFLVQERPEVVVNIVDASNLERNLYLTLQLLEMGLPLTIALNMIDAAAGRGIEIDAAELSRRLQVPVIPTVARSGAGKEELLNAAASLARGGRQWQPLHISYGPDIDPVLDQMEALITEAGFLTDLFPPRWAALKYMEADEQVMAKGNEADPEVSRALVEKAELVGDHLRKTLDSYPEAIIADHRYGLIAALLKDGVVRQNRKSDRLFLTDRIDRVLTNRFFGPLIMLCILYVVYQFTFNYSEFPVRWIGKGFAAMGRFADSALPPGLLKSLVISGIIDGVGGVMGFVPLILLMFLAIAFLEDTGYLARVAYMLDRVFRIFGLHGNSVMAYIISGGIAGGCAVPGVMATRTLRSSRERLATVLTAPFMNCGAKFPVYAMLIAAFFASNHAGMMFLLTLLSWAVALIMAKFIRSTILRGPSTPFLLELPPYRLPTFKGLLIHTWERTWQYIHKAGTIILAFSVLFWALMSFPRLGEEARAPFDEKRQSVLSGISEADRRVLLDEAVEDSALAPHLAGLRESLRGIDRAQAQEALKNSIAGTIGNSIEAVTQWAGFDWRTNVALLSGFAAKEIIISTFGTAYSMGEVKKEEDASLSRRLAQDPKWSPLKAVALMVFIMLYAPCFATVICIVRESGAWKWGAFSIVFNTSIAFLAAMLIYQGGQWLGLGIAH